MSRGWAIALILGGLVLAALLGFAIFILSVLADFGWVTVRSTEPDRGLPRHDIADLAPGGATVTFLDHSNGWYLLGPDAPDDLSVGIHGPRIGGLLLGLPHAPVYGSIRQGRALWVSVDGHRVEEFAFSNPRRMDLSDLVGHGQPIDVVHSSASASELDIRAAEIDADPNQGRLDWPQEIRAETHNVTLVLPYFWTSTAPDAEPALSPVTAIEAQLASIDPNVVLRVAGRTEPQQALFDADDTVVAQGTVVLVDGTTRLLPDARIERLHVTIFGDAASLSALMAHPAHDVTPLLAPYRDTDFLDAARARAPLFETFQDHSAIVDFETLQREAAEIGDIEEVRYPIIHYILP